ncbi:antibiotic biosynthesis monooxygenase family protein [Tuberibacillus sp. Marseille-P3662]|uniref:antibiotic biosynthesis monooxygenase family protein n=1 Tax=Tuberibacillus sp. Marseille-P3662 TaxID=1965358 RepID=UPI000A1CB00D|nr:antibiotic biosynthesis monooxygenase [Tuberibacillus sp. Marseille-P3662]
MFVMNASFTVDKAHEERLAQKCRQNDQDLKEAQGRISHEFWHKDHGETVEYVIVSKWESEDDFKQFISREDHVQEHKAMNKERKENPENHFKVDKKLRSFEVFDVS